MMLTKKLSLAALLFFGIGLAAPVWGAPGTFNIWVQTSTNLPVDTINSIAFSPNYAGDQTVYAATSNVFKSTDGGFTWVPTSLNSLTTSLAFSPNFASDKTLMAATNQGIFVTQDDGVSWHGIHNNIPVAARSIKVVAFSPNYGVDHTIFAGTFSKGLYKATWQSSLQNLPTWSQVPDIPVDAQVTRLVFSPNFAADHVVFAGVPLAAVGRGIYKSTDGGGSWRAIDAWTPQRTRTIESLAVSPNFQHDGTLFTSLHPGVYKSTDFGESWNLLPGSENRLLQALAVSPAFAVDGTVFGAGGAACEGVCLTTDGGKSWKLSNAGFPAQASMNIRALAIPPNQSQQPFNLFSGNASAGTPFRVWQMLFQNWKIALPLVIR